MKNNSTPFNKIFVDSYNPDKTFIGFATYIITED